MSTHFLAAVCSKRNLYLYFALAFFLTAFAILPSRTSTGKAKEGARPDSVPAPNFSASSAMFSPPTVSLASPPNNTSFIAGSTVTLSASAADADGSVSKVEFFQGAVKLGEDTTAPYSYAWTNVAAGDYALSVKATDNAGEVTTSGTTNISVLAQVKQYVSWSAVTNGTDLGSGSVRKTSTGAWDFSATALQTLLPGDGYFESTAASYNQSINLSGTDGAGRAVVIGSGSWVGIYENGQEVAATYGHIPAETITPHLAGDRYRIEITDSVLRYVRYRAATREVMFTSAAAVPAYPLTGSLGMSPQNAEWQRTALAQLTRKATWSAITNGVDLGNGSVRKTSTGAWDFSASAAQTLLRGDGYFESTASYWNHSISLGGSDGAGRTLLVGTGGWAAIYENGTEVANTYPIGNITPHAAGDRYRLEIADGQLRYVRYRSGVRAVIYTSTISLPAYPLSFSLGASFQNSEWQNTVIAQLSQTVTWSYINNGIDLGNGSVRKTSTGAWDFSAGPKQQLVYGNGHFESTASYWNHSISVGGTDSTSGALVVGTGGWAAIYENGAEVANTYPTGNIAAHAAGDRYRLEVTRGKQRYVRYRSGVRSIMFTSANPVPAYALGYSVGASFQNSEWQNTLFSDNVPEYNNASFVSQTVPATMVPGQNYSVTVTMRNTGASTWTPDGDYQLASENLPDNQRWGINRVNLTTIVLPGSDATFSFTVTAPATGSHSFQWRMVQQGVERFGSLSTNVNVQTVNGAPTVSLTAPANNATFTAPATVGLTVTASDSDGTVTKVEFFQGATKLGEDTTAPYNFSWTNVAAGSYVLTARATDNGGATATSSAVNITVNPPNQPPTVSITSPANNAAFTAVATIPISANATDSDGVINKVEFFQGTTKLGEDTQAPFTFNWTSVSAGAYVITARATDNAGATTTSSAVNITVNQPPMVTLTSPANNAVFTAPATVSLTASASDGDGSVSKVEFFQGTTYLGEDLTSPFAFTWSNVAAGSYSLTAKATDNAGAITTSAVVSIIVNTPPTVSITSPTHPTTFTSPASFTINASAADADGISKVEFYAGVALLGEDTTAPYTFAMSNLSHGVYVLTAKATDNRGAVTTSSAVSAVVTDAPSVSITGPANNALFTEGSNIILSASASDDGTVAKVEFFKSGALLGEDTTAPFNFNWNNLPAGSWALTARATDDLGVTTTSAAVNITVVNSPNARLDPLNQTGGDGENPLSRNYNWSVPLVALPGRAGLDLGLSLSYNSLVWTKNEGNSTISFDLDGGFPSPGFRLGFPVIQSRYFNPQTGKFAFMMITPNGERVELRQVNGSSLYEVADSSHLSLEVVSDYVVTVRSVDGSQLSYEWKGVDYQCTKIKDRNGNFITINYTTFGKIDTVVDTLGRTIKFNYDGTNYLSSITQTWTVNGQPQTHTWATFNYYPNVEFQTAFTNLTVIGPQNGSTIKALSEVTLDDNSKYTFDYTYWGQIWKINNYAADGHMLNYRAYNLPGNNLSPQTDCPRFTDRHDWAENWNRGGSLGSSGLPDGNEQEVTTTYTQPQSASWTLPDGTPESGVVVQVTQADGTYNKIYFAGTAGTANGWRRGLASIVETYGKSTPQSSVLKQRSSVTKWTQDNDTVSYPLNPRVEETNVYDFDGAGQIQNRARKRFTYVPFTVGDGTSCSLPQDVFEYQANASTVLRRTRTDYLPADSAYTSRRIIGLAAEKRLYEVDPNTGAETLMSKVAFAYDEADSIHGTDAPVQHDNNDFGPAFRVGRANLSSVKRYDVSNTSQFTVSTIRYNVAGATVASINQVGHVVSISYADSFSDNSNHNTFAYPTQATDGDGFISTAQYNFDFGLVTRSQSPPPAGQQTGAIKNFIYDSIGRVEKVAVEFNGNADYSHTRFEYPASQNRLDTYSTIQEGQGEAHSFKIMDGHGRAIANAAAHPGSSGGFSGQLFLYDELARLIKTSNPTETSGSGARPSQWVAAGDDAQAGWLYTQQTYDWKNRPLVTTNPSTTGNPNDTTTKEASYSGCGCAGGDVVTLTDEGTSNSGTIKKRQQKTYRDALGRIIKTEVTDWNGNGPNGTGGTVYSTTINNLNARDQVTRVRQIKGAGPVNPDDLTCLNNSLRFGTDNSWKQTQNYSAGWESQAFDDSSWSAAADEGAYGTQPWGGFRLPSDTPAHWIWYYDSRGNSDYSTVYFRKSFVATSDTAQLAIAGDDSFTAYLNGVQIASATNWQQTQWPTLSLTPGATYVLAVVVTNTGGPGGLVADLASIGTSCEQSTMTYDGFGRLKTQHVPGQDANAATTYNYNDDNTMSSVVDGRGASKTISYNGRHLVTQVTYAAPSGISVPSAVVYGYDAAGNRTSMADALGTMTYQFDQLSRLTSEMRQFSDPATPSINGSYTLNYAYNLAGELKKITDQANTTINYNYDQAGRTSAVTGEDTLYGSVSQYLTSASYRAWGAVKGMTYGNNFTLAVSYNSRLQETEYEVGGRTSPYGPSTVMKMQFSYYADGMLKYAHDTLDDRYDRAYSYDRIGMMQEAYTGSESRDYINGTNSGTPTGPYRQTYQYDIFGNLTHRDNRFWSQNDAVNASYANARRQDPAFHYDAEGNLTRDTDLSYTYDAAGRNTSLVASASSRTFALTYDGDGQVLKRVESQPGTATTVYYLRSSVMGGKIISELNQSGQKTKGYVFAGGELLAIQENNIVKWHHENPLTGSSGSSGVEGWFSLEVEPDASGVNVGFEDPYVNCCTLPEPNNEIMPALLGSFGGSGRCTLDGMSIDCAWAMEMMENGSAVQCPNNDCSPRSVVYNGQRTWAFFNAYGDGYQGYVPIGATYIGHGNIGPVGSGGRPTLHQGGPDRRGDTNWGQLNGARDNEGDLGRTPQFFGFGFRGVFMLGIVPQNGGEQLSQCLRDALRPFFPTQSAQGKNYSPVDDARFKNWIPGTIKTFVDPDAVTLGLYDIHYSPDRVNINSGSFESLKTIVEEVSHTVQFLQVWAGLQQNPMLMGKHGIDTTVYSSAQSQWENHYAYYAAKGKAQHGDSYKNDVERWAKNRTFDILSQIRSESKTWSLCGFSLSGTLERPGY